MGKKYETEEERLQARRDARKRWKEKHKDKVKEQAKLYRERHPEKRKEESKRRNERDWHKLGCDRKDNSLPHTPDNCIPCCSTCNTKKGRMNYDEYMQKILGEQTS